MSERNDQDQEQEQDQDHGRDDHVERTTEKPVDSWVTGDEPMTGAQRSYLDTLAREAGEDPPSEDLTKAEASKRIDALQEETGRGQ